MSLSHKLCFTKLWVLKKDLAKYIKGKVNKIDYYFNREFCDGAAVQIDACAIFKLRTNKKIRNSCLKILAEG
jgi:hypothetical protein